MAHHVAPEAEAELDNIWDYVAKDGGSTEIADRLIDSIAERFYLLACHPPSDADEKAPLPQPHFALCYNPFLASK
jgi:plasmid stabilization system protein ParE